MHRDLESTRRVSGLVQLLLQWTRRSRFVCIRSIIDGAPLSVALDVHMITTKRFAPAVGLLLCLVWGGCTSPSPRAHARIDLGHLVNASVGAAAPDLAWNILLFRDVTARWPLDYGELVRFAEETTQAMPLGGYDQVSLLQLPDGGIEIRFVAGTRHDGMILWRPERRPAHLTLAAPDAGAASASPAPVS
jgi:hypothetical protein